MKYLIIPSARNKNQDHSNIIFHLRLTASCFWHDLLFLFFSKRFDSKILYSHHHVKNLLSTMFFPPCFWGAGVVFFAEVKRNQIADIFIFTV